MTRREILEKNWKDFRLSTGLEYEPMSEKAYEYMENAMEQYAEFSTENALSIADVMAMLPDDNDITEIMMRDKGSSSTNETKGAKWIKTYLKRQLLKGN